MKNEISKNVTSSVSNPFEVFKDFLLGSHLHNWAPKIDLKETKKISLTAELAGFDRKNIHVSLNDNILTLSGHRKNEEQWDGEDYIYNERYFGSFERSFDLTGKYIDKNKHTAKFENGVLSVIIDKLQDVQHKNNKIEIL